MRRVREHLAEEFFLNEANVNLTARSVTARVKGARSSIKPNFTTSRKIKTPGARFESRLKLVLGVERQGPEDEVFCAFVLVTKERKEDSESSVVTPNTGKPPSSRRLLLENHTWKYETVVIPL